MAGNRLLTVLTFLFVTITILSNYILIAKTNEITGKASIAYGTTRVCIDNPPHILVPCTNNSLVEDNAFYCQLFATDLDNDSVTFSSQFITPTTVFTISSAGFISFTPTQAHVGSHSVNLRVNDGKGCPNSIDSEIWNFSVQNVNDPPYLISPIPDQNITYGISLSAFYLNNYFADPDSDTLNFSISSTSNIQVDIQASGEVILSGIDCPATEYVIFTATDPYLESADSNIVTLTCVLASEGGGETGGTTGGGGGGGGGGANIFTPCRPSLECEEWEPCLMNGTQKKRCTDTKKCREGPVYIYRTCIFYQECYNGIKEYYEEDTDCGGPCPPCPTCFDSIQNQNETGIDCGGPCGPCNFSSILYSSRYGLWNLIYYDELKGSKQYILINKTNMSEGSFSFDGWLITFTNNNELWTITRNLVESKKLASKAAGEKHSPSFSRNSDELAYSLMNQGLSYLNIYNINYSVERTLDLPVSAYYPDWSKDGKRIIFSTKEFDMSYMSRVKVSVDSKATGNAVAEETSRVYIIDSSGKVLNIISDKKYDMYAARISPDGYSLTYFTLENDNADVWVMKLDGTYKKKILNTKYNELFPIWSDDGRRIIFAADYKGHYDLYASDPEGGNVAEVLSDDENKIPLDSFVYPSCFDNAKNQNESGVDCGGPCAPCPSCEDGMKNGEESGIDCGGPCGPCYLEVPGFLGGVGLWAKLLAFLILATVILLVLFKVFHKQIRREWAKLEFRMRKKKKKLILLDNEAKKELLDMILELEKRINEKNYQDYCSQCLDLIHKYYTSVLKLKLFSRNEVMKGLSRIPYRDVAEILKSYLASAADIEGAIDFHKFIRLIEEMREIILLTSAHYKSDVAREIIKPRLNKGMPLLQQINTLLTDALLALEFDETEIAQQRYLQVLKLYDTLKEKDKGVVYGGLNRLYLEIKYTLELV